MIPLLAATTTALLVALAEWLHARRIRAVGRLAFGPDGVARQWTRAVPFLRVLALAAFAWGLATLWMMKVGADDGAGGKDKGAEEATRLVFVTDLSPSMYLEDAGPDGTQSRHARMGEVVDGILQRVSGNLRFGVIAFYTESMPVVMEARDPELVRNVLNGLPVTYAMPLGETDLGKAINEALALVKDLPARSTRLVILTDGDSVEIAPLASRPDSVEEVMFLGVGNPHKGLFIDGHQSRQEAGTLRRLATELKGTYEDVNEEHLKTAALGDLVVLAALPRRGLSLAQLAILAMVLGGALLALIPVALEFFGTDWKVAPSSRGSDAPARANRGGAGSPMRKFFTLLWLLFPVAVLTYHFNEGPRQMAREKARLHVERIRALEQASEPNWEEIMEEYDALSAGLPKDEAPLVQHQIRLAKARAQLEMLDVAGAIENLTALLQESAQAHGDDAPVTRGTREMLGKAHYYATYLLKTNGAAEEEWRPFAERTRQIFRFLAEHQEPAALAQYEQRVEAELQKTIQKQSR